MFFSLSTYAQKNNTFFKSKIWMKNSKKINYKNFEENKNSNLNFHKPIISLNNKGVYKQILNNEFSYFIVFKSDEESEDELVTFTNGKNKVIVNNKSIISDKVETFKKDTKSGIIINYLTQQLKRSRRRNIIKLNKEQFTESSKNNIYEFLYYPTYLGDKENQKIQTYLSLKYGVSLPSTSDYINSKGYMIWNHDTNKGFNNNVFGVGLDSLLNFNQSKSQNSKFKNLTISFQDKEENKTNLHYFLVGDNGKNINFSYDADNDIEILDKVWKSTISNSDNLENNEIKAKYSFLYSDKDLVNNLDENELWLVVDERINEEKIDLSTAKYIKGIKTDDGILFENLTFKVEKFLFSFVKAPKLFISTKVEEVACDKLGILNLKINGGKLPYKIKLTANNFEKNIEGNNSNIIINELKSNAYSILVTDANGLNYQTNFLIEDFTFSNIFVASEWLIESDKNDVVIDIIGAQSKLNQLAYRWYLDSELISIDQYFTAKKEGNYSLIVTSKNGCERDLYFQVKKSKIVSDYLVNVYPNPVDIGEEFTVSLNFPKANNVFISIYNENGQLIFKSQKVFNRNSIFKHLIQNFGTYIILVETDHKSITKKIIIK
jgi:hypothetical protein